jgi:hypothetical protein
MSLTLAYTQQPGAIEEILAAMPAGDENQALQLHYLYGLRTIKEGWTPQQKAQLTDIFARASRWRGGMFSFVGQMFDQSIEGFTAEERKTAYAKVPNLAPLENVANAGTAAAPPAVGPGGGGMRGRGGRGPGMTRQEIFERMLFVAGRGGGGGGRGNQGPPPDPRELFATHCASCHRFGGTGSATGSDLAARKPVRRQLLESVIFPHQKVDFFERLNEQQMNALVNYLQGAAQ